MIVTKGDDAVATHAKSILVESSKFLVSKANDTDVVVIAMSVNKEETGLEYMLVAYG